LAATSSVAVEVHHTALPESFGEEYPQDLDKSCASIARDQPNAGESTLGEIPRVIDREDLRRGKF
jgi:hypothetical protein